MSSKLTGDHDMAVELSETMLSALVAEQLIGTRRFGSSAIRIAKVRVEALAMAPAPRIEIIATVTHGTMRSPAPPLVLRGLRMTLHIRVALALHVEGTTPSIRFLLDQLAPSDLWWDWEPSSLQSIVAQASAQGITWDANTEALARALLAGELRRQTFAPLPIPGLVVDPAAKALPSATPIAVHHLELVSRAREGSSPSIVALVGSFLAGHVQGAAAKKTRTLLGPAHPLALALSPEALRDGVLCPRLATLFDVEPHELCPVCGQGPFSLRDKWKIPVFDRLDVTSITITCESGYVGVSCAISGAGPLFTLAGSLSLRITFSLEPTPAGTNLVVHAALDPVSLSIDTNDVADVFSFGATQLLADSAAALVRDFAAAAFHAKYESGPPAEHGIIHRFPLPGAPGGLPATYDAVGVDPDGVWIFAKAPVVAKELPPVRLDLQLDMTETLSEVRRGRAGATCLRSGYEYVDYDAWQTHTVRLVTSGLDPLVSRTWTLSGATVPASGGTMSLPATNSGEGPDATDQQAKVSVSFDASANVVNLRNDPADGNYLLTITCVVDDGVDLYTAVESLSFDGQPRVWEDSYEHDTLRCAARTVSVDRHIRWPASDPAGWEYPAPWEDRFPGGPRPGWNPPGGPWTGDPVVGRLFREIAGGVIRTAAGEAVLRRVLSEPELAALADADAFRMAPREVVVREAPFVGARELLHGLIRPGLGLLRPGRSRGPR